MNLNTKKTFDENKEYLITYSDNWADEMDIDGHRIMSGSELNEYIKYAKLVFKKDGCYDYYIGTNQEINYESFKDFAEHFEIQEISEEEHKVLSKFGFSYGGNFPESIGEGYEEDEK